MAASTTLIGNTVNDVEISFSRSGQAIARVTIAVSDRKKDKQTGEWVDGSTWFARCTAFGDLAENLGDSIPKGTRVIAEGRIVQNDWEDKDGNKRSSVEVTLNEVGPSLRYASAKVTKTQRGAAQAPQQQRASKGDPWGSGQLTDEIPF